MAISVDLFNRVVHHFFGRRRKPRDHINGERATFGLLIFARVRVVNIRTLISASALV
ncbi:hypothetical protein OG417_36955 [Actinoallomurus sp. NBC_01490]|jgi:hypothetical protein|uniref:hypothetical protein n=1 Tax=Actinoallomurus sp. NBC_01490 TaxID=2903557 RepID=UPI002E31A1F0|nr:hypothetical protein [Actinoallomurus sp. NBC_01490]